MSATEEKRPTTITKIKLDEQVKRGNNMYLLPEVKKKLKLLCVEWGLGQAQWGSYIMLFGIQHVLKHGLTDIEKLMPHFEEKQSPTKTDSVKTPPEHDPYDLGISKEDAERAANMFKRT